MSTSFGEKLRGSLARAPQPGIMARRWPLYAASALLMLSLAACSATRLAYSQAPTLTYWWLNDHLDFSSEQAPQVRDQIGTFFRWHRYEELPVYSQRLQAWQALAERDITTAEACSELDAVRERIDAATERLVAPMARMARQLGPEQLSSLEKKQAKSNEEFAKEYLNPNPERALDDRLKQAVSRSERLYGSLSAGQRELLREQLRQSPWNPERTQAERLRRQADLLQTLREAQARPEQAEALVRGHIERIRRSPTPDYPAYSQRLLDHGCAQFAALHNSTTPEQRAHAVRALKGYEDDVIRLADRR